MFGDSDLGVFFADTGVPVTFGSAQSTGLLDIETDLFMQSGGPGAVERQSYLLRLPWNAFTPAPAPGDAITVNGSSYVVMSLPVQKDAQILELNLKVG